MFANIYLNELDQYVKHKLKCKYYYRYMDDMVIMCENKEIAKDSLNNITKFLKENLKLTLNSKTRIFKDIHYVNTKPAHALLVSYKNNFSGTLKFLTRELLEYLLISSSLSFKSVFFSIRLSINKSRIVSKNFIFRISLFSITYHFYKLCVHCF